MSNGTDPYSAYERWLDKAKDSYVVRREVRPTTTPRMRREHYKWLPECFAGAHPWPLQWGGPEVHEAHFNAHDVVNGSMQRMLENAARRFAERLNGTGFKLFAVSRVERYTQLNLLKSAVYRFELISPNGVVEPLTEIEIRQSLTDAQRHALVKGQIVSGQRSGNIVINHEGKQVIIDVHRIIELPRPELFGNAEAKIEGLVRGFQTASNQRRGSSSSAGNQRNQKPPDAQKASQDKTQSNKPPQDPRATHDPKIENRITSDPKAEIRVVDPPKFSLPNEQPTNARLPKMQPSRGIKALESNMSMISTHEAAAAMIYGLQHAIANQRAISDARDALEDRIEEIKNYRANGEYVFVDVTFSVPETPDLLFPGPTDFPVFWSINIYHTAPWIHPLTKKPQHWDLRRRATPGSEMRRKSEGQGKHLVSGRKLETHEIGSFEPYPQEAKSEEPYWLEDIRKQDPEWLKRQYSKMVKLSNGQLVPTLLYIQATGPLTMERIKEVDPGMHRDLIYKWEHLYGSPSSANGFIFVDPRCIVDKGKQNRSTAR